MGFELHRRRLPAHVHIFPPAASSMARLFNLSAMDDVLEESEAGRGNVEGQRPAEPSSHHELSNVPPEPKQTSSKLEHSVGCEDLGESKETSVCPDIPLVSQVFSRIATHRFWTHIHYYPAGHDPLALTMQHPRADIIQAPLGERHTATCMIIPNLMQVFLPSKSWFRDKKTVVRDFHAVQC